MTQLTRRSMETNGPRTRILLVRRPIRSVQSGDQPNSLPVRLALGVIATVGGIVLLWFLGMLGFHFGARTVFGSVPMRATLTEPLLIGVMILMESPRSIFTVALREPLWFLLGFLMIAIPGGAIAAARKSTPGGPRPQRLTIVFAHLGAIIAMLYAVAAVAWLLSPLRHAFISAMPMDPADVHGWADRLRFVAGCDLLVLFAGILWIVLAGRLAIPLWLRTITLTAVLACSLMLTASAATTSGAVVQSTMPRPLVALPGDDAAPKQESAEAPRAPVGLVLGDTAHHVLILPQTAPGRGQPLMHYHPAREPLVAIGQIDLVDFLYAEPESDFAQPSPGQ